MSSSTWFGELGQDDRPELVDLGLVDGVEGQLDELHSLRHRGDSAVDGRDRDRSRRVDVVFGDPTLGVGHQGDVDSWIGERGCPGGGRLVGRLGDRRDEVSTGLEVDRRETGRDVAVTCASR